MQRRSCNTDGAKVTGDPAIFEDLLFKESRAFFDRVFGKRSEEIRELHSEKDKSEDMFSAYL